MLGPELEPMFPSPITARALKVGLIGLKDQYTGWAKQKACQLHCPLLETPSKPAVPTVPFTAFLKHKLLCSVPHDLTILATDG